MNKNLEWYYLSNIVRAGKYDGKCLRLFDIPNICITFRIICEWLSAVLSLNILQGLWNERIIMYYLLYWFPQAKTEGSLVFLWIKAKRLLYTWFLLLIVGKLGFSWSNMKISFTFLWNTHDAEIVCGDNSIIVRQDIQFTDSCKPLNGFWHAHTALPENKHFIRKTDMVGFI